MTITCITNQLPDMPSCVYTHEHLLTCPNPATCNGCEPRPATHGHTCTRCYDRIDHAIQVADHLRTALHGVEHAITTEPTSSIPGPRLPLTPIQLDFDAINRAQNGNTDPLAWVQTETGAASAVRFARAVYQTERAHPTAEAERKLRRLRCPTCNRLTATWQPPTWPGDDVHITCIDPACAWTATHPDAIDIVTAIETRGAA